MQSRTRTTSLGLCLALLFGCSSGNLKVVEFVNHQPFAIRMPVELRGAASKAGATSAAQPHGKNLIVIADVPASSSATLNVSDEQPKGTASAASVKPDGDGAALIYNGANLGRLSWQLIARPADKNAPRTREGSRATKADFNALFKPLNLVFEQTAEGPLFNTYTASGADAGLKLTVDIRAYPSGFVDVISTVENESAPTSDMYAAVVLRWEQPGVKSRTLCYDNRIAPFGDGESTSFREGEGRHLFIQRGVDWINTNFDSGASVAWLNDFTPSFTVHRDATEKTPARWVGANTAQVAQEAQAASGGKLYSITEIARPNLPMYRSRLDEEVLPPPGEPLSITHRLIFDKHPATDQTVDQQFIAYVGWRHQDKSKNGATRLSFGAAYARFGTNYFPYSTLGENFIDLRMPGMSKDGYWPLAAATVNEFEKFADIIRRDLRTLKALGYEISRLHHLEVLWDRDPGGKEYVTQQRRQAYLDFYFDELKKLGLTALLDVKLTPEQTAWLVKRFRPQVEGVEIDNEILIFQIYDKDAQYWKDVYNAVKEVAPEVPVHLTAHTNMGAFNRLKKLGVPFDKVGAHAYMDSTDAITSSRDYSLAVANYAAKQNKTAAITEWNWRFLTRMTEKARAKIYPPIFENVLKTRSISTMYQFQYNDGLAMNPAQLKGIRHYEQIHLSRRPKPEAIEMAKLIKRYENPNGPVAKIDTGLIDNRPVVTFNDLVAKGTFTITNTSKETLKLSAKPECFDGATVKLDRSGDANFTLKPGASKAIAFTATAPRDALPGFYHLFLRLDGGKGLLRYAWAECRLEGQPRIDKSGGDKSVVYGEGALDFNFNRDIAIVYGKDAPIPELEAAWVVYQTLESATGRKVEIYHLPELPAEMRKSGTLIVFGTPGSNELIASVESRLPKDAASFVTRVPAGEGRGEWLVVSGRGTGATTKEAQAAIDNASKAAMDLTLRYWRTAKDSGARRVGLVSEAAAANGFKTDID